MTEKEKEELMKKYASHPWEIFLDAKTAYYETVLMETAIKNNFKLASEMKNKKLSLKDLPMYKEQMAKVNEFKDIYVEMEEGTKPKLDLEVDFADSLAKEVENHMEVMNRFGGDELKTRLLTNELYEFVSQYKSKPEKESSKA